MVIKHIAVEFGGSFVTKFTVIDLFSGRRRSSKGFLDAGYNVVLGIDFNDSALKSFECNHGDTKALK